MAGHRGAPLRHRAPSKSSLALSPRAVSCVWVWSACQHVADNAPTSLSLAHRCVSRRARTARQSQDCLRVRSLSDPRLCAKVTLLRARYPPPLARARLRCGAASRSATAQPPLVPRAASIRECGLHGLVGIPPCARMLAHPSGSASPNLPSASLRRICNAASRRLPCAGGGLRSGPARLRPSTCALSVHASFRAAQASPLAPLR